MSRSYRHTPIMGIAVCRSEKSWKRLDHHMQRARLRSLLAHERYCDAEVDGRGLDVWVRGKDGKRWWGYPHTVPQYAWPYRTYLSPSLEETRRSWRKAMRK